MRRIIIPKCQQQAISLISNGNQGKVPNIFGIALIQRHEVPARLSCGSTHDIKAIIRKPFHRPDISRRFRHVIVPAHVNTVFGKHINVFIQVRLIDSPDAIDLHSRQFTIINGTVYASILQRHIIPKDWSQTLLRSIFAYSIQPDQLKF